MKNQRELELHRRGGLCSYPRAQKSQEPGTAALGVKGDEVQMVPGNMWLLFTFLFFCFFSDGRKLVLQRNTSRWNVFLNSREALDRCHMNAFQSFRWNLLREREVGEVWQHEGQLPGEAIQAVWAQETGASRGVVHPPTVCPHGCLTETSNSWCVLS